MPPVVLEQATQLRHGFEQWAFAADRSRAVDEDPMDNPELNDGFSTLLTSLIATLEVHSEHAIPILEQLASSADATTRFMAVSQYDKAYFVDAEGSRPLIAELLQDSDPRVVTYAHQVLQMYGSDPASGERDGDERGNMSLEFIASLPIHKMTVEISLDKRAVTMTPPVHHGWWPVGCD